MKDLTVVCLLVTPPKGHRGKSRDAPYTPEWVRKLKRGVDEHLPEYRRFVCVTDQDFEIPGVEMMHPGNEWPGWWARLGYFKPGFFDGPTLSLDLDTLILGDLSGIASYSGDFLICSDFNRPERPQGCMYLWRPGPHTDECYRRFISDGPGKVIHSMYADQDWFHRTLDTTDRLQDLYPGQVVSYKRHCKQGRPDGARVLCFHGQPRPNDPKAGWAHKAWEAL